MFLLNVYTRWSRVNNVVDSATYSQSAHAHAHAYAHAATSKLALSLQMPDDDWLMSSAATIFFLSANKFIRIIVERKYT